MKSMQSLHSGSRFVQFLISKHIVSLLFTIRVHLRLINLQYGVWKHLPTTGAGCDQQKQHFSDTYDIVNCTQQRRDLMQRMTMLQQVVHRRLAKDAAGGNQIRLSRPIHTQFSRIPLTFPTSLLDPRPDTELYCLLMILQDRHLLRLRPQCRHLHLCFLFRSPLRMAHHTVRQFQIVLERQPLAHLCCTRSNFLVWLLSL